MALNRIWSCVSMAPNRIWSCVSMALDKIWRSSQHRAIRATSTPVAATTISRCSLSRRPCGFPAATEIKHSDHGTYSSPCCPCGCPAARETKQQLAQVLGPLGGGLRVAWKTREPGRRQIPEQKWNTKKTCVCMCVCVCVCAVGKAYTGTWTTRHT